jgi:hypothetical protein
LVFPFRQVFYSCLEEEDPAGAEELVWALVQRSALAAAVAELDEPVVVRAGIPAALQAGAAAVLEVEPADVPPAVDFPDSAQAGVGAPVGRSVPAAPTAEPAAPVDYKESEPVVRAVAEEQAGHWCAKAGLAVAAVQAVPLDEPAGWTEAEAQDDPSAAPASAAQIELAAGRRVSEWEPAVAGWAE